jgi:hypothetical protein
MRSSWEWSPLRQQPEAPLITRPPGTANSRLRSTSCQARVSAFHPRREPGDAKSRDGGSLRGFRELIFPLYRDTRNYFKGTSTISKIASVLPVAG